MKNEGETNPRKMYFPLVLGHDDRSSPSSDMNIWIKVRKLSLEISLYLVWTSYVTVFVYFLPSFCCTLLAPYAPIVIATEDSS